MKLFVTMLALGLGAFVASAPAVRAQSGQPAPDTDARGSGSLSDTLNGSNGVIRPKGNVDPGIAKPAPVPDPRSTPVIVPPGTDGAPGAQAK